MSIEPFLTYIEHEKRYAVNTLSAYRSDLLQFQEFMVLEFNLRLTEVKYLHVRNYMVKLMENNVGANSIGRKISTLKSFYKYLVRQKIISSTPMSQVKSPKSPKKLPVFVEEQQMDQLLDSTVVFNDTFPSVRDKLILETFFGTGIRLGELVGLKESDLNLFDESVRVVGKGNKERIIPMTKQLVDQLKSYLLLKSMQNFNNKSEFLFVTDKGTAVHRKFIYDMVKKYLSFVTTQDKKSPHVLRHSYATSLLNRGADLNAIKELLGHASLAATQVYTHNTIERLKSIYKQAHPKA
ncbi:MAG: integrase [Chryseobacterium sp.]|nr:MAG: integrase [Chryseobacterium sp.]